MIIDQESKIINHNINILKKINKLDFYFLPKYIKLNIKKNQILKYFFYNENKHFIMMPLILNNLKVFDSDSHFYFETLYGYSGPISNTDNKTFLKKAWEVFLIDCINLNIISGLIRFNPFLNNHNLVFDINFIELVKEKKILFKKVSNNYSFYYNQFSKDVKNNLKKTHKISLKISDSFSNLDISNFYQLYTELINSKDTNEMYAFNQEYFFNLINDFGNYTNLILAKVDNDLAGGLIYFKFNNIVHIHLSAVSLKFRKFGISHSLRAHLFQIFQNTNTIINFGGGLTNLCDDSLYKFKSGFANESLDFFIGKVTIDVKKHIHYKDKALNKFGSKYNLMHMPYSFYSI